MTLLRTRWKTEARGKGRETGLQGCLQNCLRTRSLKFTTAAFKYRFLLALGTPMGIGVQVLGVTAVGLCFALAFSTDYLLCILRLHSACSVAQLFASPWTVALQAPLFMGFPRQEYWSGLPFPPPEDLSYPWIEPLSPTTLALQADSLPLSHHGNPKTP